MCRYCAALRWASDGVHACQVAKESDNVIQQLVGLMKLPGGTALPGPVSIVTLKGLGAIAQQRPQYLGRILPTLLKLASVLTQPQVLVSAGSGPFTMPWHAVCRDVTMHAFENLEMFPLIWIGAILGAVYDFELMDTSAQ